jgi:hypothetical protein
MQTEIPTGIRQHPDGFTEYIIVVTPIKGKAFLE